MQQDGHKGVDCTDNAIRERLRILAKEGSQSEIARQTGTPPHYVSRYLNGTRIPAEFCGALIKSMGVNPVWLLAGEGSPRVSDVTTDTAETASDLLELVKAMTAITRMRLGSLAGKGHAKVLRELNDTLETYEKLRGRLNEQIQPILKKLLDDTSAALPKDLESARRLLEAAKQLARLCDDPALLLRLKTIEGNIEHSLRNYDRARELHREVMMVQIAVNVKDDVQYLDRIRNFVIDLGSMNYVHEARRVARAALEIYEDLRMTASYGWLRYAWLIFSLEQTGRPALLHKITRAYQELRDDYREDFAADYRRYCLLSGVVTLDEYMRADKHQIDTWSKRLRRSIPNYMLGHAIWHEDAGLLERAIALYVNAPGANPEPMYTVQSKCLLDALAGGERSTVLKEYRSSTFYREFNAAPTSDKFRWMSALFSCQLLKACGDMKAAIVSLFELEDIMKAMRPARDLREIWLSLHYRNAISLIGDAPKGARERELVTRARKHLVKYYRRGFVVYKPYISNVG